MIRPLALKIAMAVFSCSCICLGQTSVPASQPEAALTASALHLCDAGSQPFHLVAVFDATGNVEFTGHGTFEEYWLDTQHWRRLVSLGSYHAEEIQDGMKHSLTTSSSYEPKRVLSVIGEFERRPSAFESQTGKWKMVELPNGIVQYLWAYRDFPTSKIYTFQKSTNHLLKIEETAITTSFGDFTDFAGHSVPASIREFTASGNPMLDISIVQLERLANPALAAPASDTPWNESMRSLLPPLLNGKGIIAPKVRKSPDPKFPEAERKARKEEMVVVDMALDETGAVREPEVVNKVDADFAQAALDAIHKWKLEPAKLNTGMPIEADLRVEVRFRLR